MISSLDATINIAYKPQQFRQIAFYSAIIKERKIAKIFIFILGFDKTKCLTSGVFRNYCQH
jgi:hypothetical protein